MKELRKVTEKIKKVLIEAERSNEEFPWIVDKLSLIKMYDMGLPIHMVLGLIDEFIDGVRLYGYHHNNKLIGVIGIQEVKDVILIRHAYTLTFYQGKGIGSELLKYLLKKNTNSRLLVGTWRDATWAIRFYEKFGFILHTKEQSTLLLKKYWEIPSQQIENSIVLERQLRSN